MNAAIPRLAGLVAALMLLGYGSFMLVRHTVNIAPRESGLALGMTWLQREYRLDDATFALVTQAHQRYFRECKQRCNELDEVNQHFLSEVRDPADSHSDLDAVQLLQEAICHDCRVAMIEHVHEVAALMPEESGRQFIADVQQVLQPSTRRPRLTPR